MSVRIGECRLCGTQKVELTEHHVVEYLDENGRTPKVVICKSCHDLHEKYKNYLKNNCGIDINRKKKSENS